MGNLIMCLRCSEFNNMFSPNWVWPSGNRRQPLCHRTIIDVHPWPTEDNRRAMLYLMDAHASQHIPDITSEPHEGFDPAGQWVLSWSILQPQHGYQYPHCKQSSQPSNECRSDGNQPEGNRAAHYGTVWGLTSTQWLTFSALPTWQRSIMWLWFQGGQRLSGAYRPRWCAIWPFVRQH